MTKEELKPCPACDRPKETFVEFYKRKEEERRAIIRDFWKSPLQKAMEENKRSLEQEGR